MRNEHLRIDCHLQLPRNRVRVAKLNKVLESNLYVHISLSIELLSSIPIFDELQS